MKEEEALKNFEDFFKIDMEMKEKLFNLAPTEIDDVDEESRIAYIDKLYEAVKEMEIVFLNLAQKFNLSQECIDDIKKHFKIKEISFLIGRFNPGTIQKVYAEEIANMNEKLIQDVRGEIFGYKIDIDMPKLIQESRTINELLHILHTYICNNNEMMQELPFIESKINKAGEPIILFGEDTEIARMIYEKFPTELDCDNVNIVSLKDKILIMVRGRGHSLSMDINTSQEDQIFVKYFVPIIKNKEMVEALPGIKKNGLEKNGAIGMFQTSKEKIAKELFEFIEKVPTDADNPIVKKYLEMAERLNAINEGR